MKKHLKSDNEVEKVNDKENMIYLVKLVNSNKNIFSKTDESYLKFVKDQKKTERGYAS